MEQTANVFFQLRKRSCLRWRLITILKAVALHWDDPHLSKLIFELIF